MIICNRIILTYIHYEVYVTNILTKIINFNSESIHVYMINGDQDRKAPVLSEYGAKF